MDYFNRKSLAIAVSVSGTLAGIIIMFSNLLTENIKTLTSYLGICESCNADLFNILNDSVGIAAIIASALMLAYAYHKDRIEEALSKRYYSILKCIIIALLILIFFDSISRMIISDEILHTHAAWKIKSGEIPYKDFFMIYNPLLHYVIAQILMLTKSATASLMTLRLVMFATNLAILYMVYLLARYITKSKVTAYLSVILLASLLMFVRASIEIRPDTPQLLFALMSIYFLVLFTRTNRNRDIALSGILLSTAFLFSQKTITLILAIYVIVAYKVLKKEMEVKHAALFTACLAAPTLAFLSYLLATNLLQPYIINNLTSFGSIPNVFLPATAFLRYYPIPNFFFFLFSILSLPVIFSRKLASEMKIVTVIGIALLLPLLPLKVGEQYYMLPLAILSISASYFMQLTTKRIKAYMPKVLLVILVVSIPASFMIRSAEVGAGLNAYKLEKMDYVLANTDESDFVYDGNNMFNLFRKDLHYFWYGMDHTFCNQHYCVSSSFMYAYNNLTNNRYSDYDTCKLVKEKNPKITSDYMLNLTECGLEKTYTKTPYEGLYIRID